MQTGRRIAFDYGDVRIGVAISDASGLLASPFGALDATDPDSLRKEISGLVTEYEPIYFAVGMPKHLSGSDSAKMASVLDFITQLKTNFSIPIVEVDERLTTVSAAQALRASGKNAKDSKSLIDAAAAATILEMALSIERANEK
jgi:putative Holliday junction resolvase